MEGALTREAISTNYTTTQIYPSQYFSCMLLSSRDM